VPALRLTSPQVLAWRAEGQRLIPPARAAAEGEAERLAAFLGGEPEIAWAS
jgi:hypothetical protein